MFGHNDDTQQQDNAGQPVSDAALTDTNTQDPGGAPPAPTDDKPADDNDAGDYIMTDTPGQNDAPADATPPSELPAPSMSGGDADDLLDLKQQALQQLTPLVGHLEQTPEEEFRTTMMMIQAADNQSLIKKAYEAALKIVDEKARAQALLDIVNEINYFTQHHNS